MHDIRKHQQIEQQCYDKWASEIDVNSIHVEAHFESSTALENRFALKSLGDIRNKKILDIACGNGQAAVYFAKKGASVTAIDISSRSVKNTLILARKYNVDIDAQVMPAENLAFSDGNFDYVYGFGALHHFADLELSLKGMYRVLKNGGRAVFIEPLCHNPLIKVYRFLARGVRTPTEKPFSWDQLASLGKSFRQFQHREFWFFSLLIFLRFFFIERANPSKVKYWEKVIDDAEKYESLIRKTQHWDDSFLEKFPYFKRFCYSTVLVLTK